MKLGIGVTGASGSVYTWVLLKRLQQLSAQIEDMGIVWSDNARVVWQEELQDNSYENFKITTWANNDFYAPIASGSAAFDALIICPCSMGTLGRIASGISDNLITRAADVMLKERRKLICVVRETPLSLIHIRNMQTVTEAGGIICPAAPSFYSRPKNIEEAVQTVIDRVLQLAGLQTNSFQWGSQK